MSSDRDINQKAINIAFYHFCVHKGLLGLIRTYNTYTWLIYTLYKVNAWSYTLIQLY